MTRGSEPSRPCLIDLTTGDPTVCIDVLDEQPRSNCKLSRKLRKKGKGKAVATAVAVAIKMVARRDLVVG
jgi:hypothetical protein